MSPGPANGNRRIPNGGPSIKVPPLWSSGVASEGLLTNEDRSMLAVIATVGRYKKGELIYQEGAIADRIFNVITGVVKSYRSRGKHREQIIGFLFPQDIIGLAEQGKYVNSARAVTAVTLYKMPTAALEARLRRNPEFDYQVICKLCRELREAQQHAFLLGKHRAVAKLGLFLQMLETQQSSEGRLCEEILVPMSRVDIGAYTNISSEAVSRSLRELIRRRMISVRERRHIKILDRVGLEDIISEMSGSPKSMP
jgi:CRP-like cAMP-binding protein